MNKKFTGILFVVVALMGVLFAFQNCGEAVEFDLMQAEAESTIGLERPIALSSDVSQLSMKLKPDEQDDFAAGSLAVDVDVEKQEILFEQGESNTSQKMNSEETQELIYLLRLIRPIKKSQELCTTQHESEEDITVNIDGREINLGEYNNCESEFDLSRAERKILRRLILKLIGNHMRPMCPDPNLFDQPICTNGLVKRVYDKRNCLSGFRCVKRRPACSGKEILQPDCPPQTVLRKVFKKGCLSGYRCEASNLQCPLIATVMPICKSGLKPVPKKNKNNCLIGYECKIPTCPPLKSKNKITAQKNRCVKSGGQPIPYNDSLGCFAGIRCKSKVNCPRPSLPYYNSASERECKKTGGQYKIIKNKSGCVIGYRCVGSCPQVKPNIEQKKSCDLLGGKLTPNKNKQGCVTGWKCDETKVCNKLIGVHYDQRECAPGYTVQVNYDKNNCVVSRKCVKDILACPHVITNHYLVCKSGEKKVPRNDSMGCFIGYKCVSDQKECPYTNMAIPLCKPGTKLVKVLDGNNCLSKWECRGVNCPRFVPPAPNFCKSGEIMVSKMENGCHSGYECKPKEVVCPYPEITYLPSCKEGYRAIAKKDELGCIVSQSCQKIDGPHICPIIPQGFPQCVKPFKLKINKDEHDCTTSYSCTP